MRSMLDSFTQILAGPVWDGNLISKSDRDSLHKAGYIARAHGWNFISEAGIEVAHNLGLLNPDPPRPSPNDFTFHGVKGIDV